MTYTELKTLIADTLNRQDLDSAIPSFITMAESDFNRQLNHWKMEKRADTTFNDRFHTLPTDFLEMYRIHLSTGERLLLISIDDMQKMRPVESGKPTHYAIVAGELELFPTPDQDYNAEVYYKGKISSLATGSNFIAEDHTDLYLYGSLIHSAPYLKEDERTVIWAGLYNQALANLNIQSGRAKFSGTGLTMKKRGY